MNNVLNLKNREEFLEDKNYLEKLKGLKQIIRTNGVVHNVKFFGVYNNNKNVFLYTCYDANNNMSGIMAVEKTKLIVGPSSNLQPAPSVDAIGNAVYLLMGVIENIAKQQIQQTNGR